MKILIACSRGLVLVYITLAAATAALGCDRLPAGQELWVRLADPVSTYTAKVGDRVHAVLIQDAVCGNEVVLRMGTPIEGVVLSKRKVGWGIRHETAALELEFTQATTAPGVTVSLDARVEEVLNARETVRKGVIEGILSSNTFQGRINSRLIHLPTMNPYSDPVLMTYAAVFPIFPEPEIYYPAGTDMRVRTTAEIVCQPGMLRTEYEPAREASEEPDEMDQMVERLPWRVETAKNVDADVINLVFIAPQDEVAEAFRYAGWQGADHVSTHTVAKNLYALLNNSGYAREPMTTFYLEGRPEDMNWQKSLNSYDHRDHLRMWRWQWKGDGGESAVWVGSSTHDTRATLALKYKGFMHHISPDIDDERSAIIRDLNFAGCVRSVRYVPRANVPASMRNSTGDVMQTDGMIAVVALQRCEASDPEMDIDMPVHKFKPGNHLFRFIRRQILTFRNDVWRENIIYSAYDGGRLLVSSLRHKPQPAADLTASAPLPMAQDPVSYSRADDAQSSCGGVSPHGMVNARLTTLF
jgi:hypothetical protein